MSKPLPRKRSPVWWSGFHLVFDLEEQIDHLHRPSLSVVLCHELQLAQVVHVAQRVEALVELEVGRLPIVDRTSSELGKNADLTHRCLSPRGMNGIPGQRLSACRV